MNSKSLLETTMNTRELGGYRTASGGLTRCGRILRSDEPLCPSAQDIAWLLERRITTGVAHLGRTKNLE